MRTLQENNPEYPTNRWCLLFHFLICLWLSVPERWETRHPRGPCWHKATVQAPSWIFCSLQGDAAPTLQAFTSSATLFSNFTLKYAAVLNAQLLSAVSALKCRVCLTFLKRFCSRGKCLSWPHSVISGTLPAWYSVLHSVGFITLEADTLAARSGKLVVTASHRLSQRRPSS